jgi:hypothetical protein
MLTEEDKEMAERWFCYNIYFENGLIPFKEILLLPLEDNWSFNYLIEMGYGVEHSRKLDEDGNCVEVLCELTELGKMARSFYSL